MSRYIAVFMIIIASLTTAYGQRGSGMGNRQMNANGIITGQIIDGKTSSPLPSATVILYSMRDSSQVTGGIADQQGNFKLEKVPYGKFYIDIKFIGFKRKIVQNIMVTPKNKVVDMGQVKLNQSAEQSQGVEVTAERERIEFKMDRKIVNVANDISAKGGTAVQALENVPSVTVDVDGNVSLRGSENFTLFVNGRPSPIQGTDGLEQIPSEMINNIELITNPSAKYDPDGMAGIINVVLKDDFEAGVNGIANVKIGTRDKYGVDGVFNYRAKSWNAFIGGDWRDDRYHGEGLVYRETFLTDTTNYQDADMDGGHNRKSWSVKGGVGFDISDMTNMTLELSTGAHDFERIRRNRLEVWSSPSVETEHEYELSKAIGTRTRDYVSGNFDLLHKFDDLGHQINITGYLSMRDAGDGDDQINYITDQNFIISDDNPEMIRSTEDEETRDIRLKADYVYPVDEDSKFEAGYQARLDHDQEDYIFSEWDSDVSDWVKSDAFSNYMDFTRNIHSLYAMWGSMFGNLGYQLGLRGEYTYRLMDLTETNEEYKIDRVDFFPTLHMSFDMGDGLQALGGYSRRIRRPRGHDLEPFLMYMDQYTVRQGNPDLEPEYTDSYELGIQKNFNGSFISLEGYYRHTKNKIDRVANVREDEVVVFTSENLNEDRSIGAEAMINYMPMKMLNLNLSGNFYHYEIEGDIVESDVETSTEVWDARFMATYMLMSTGTKFQINGFYRGPSITSQGERKGFFMMGAAINQDLFNRKLSISLNSRGLIGSFKHENTHMTEYMYSHNIFERESPVVNLTLTYRFNDYNDSKRNSGNGDTEVVDFGY